MPIHQAPPIRALEEALESEGLIPKLDSVGVATIKNQESAGLRAKVVPIASTRIIRGHVYTDS